MEKKLGRPLKKGEVVHHIDGNKENNNEDNLLLCKGTQQHKNCHIVKDKRPDLYWLIIKNRN